MRDADRWGVLAEAATLLDAADCDWRTLQHTEELLASLASELDQVSTEETAHTHHGVSARHTDADLRSLRGSLAWVRRHEYDALESELQKQLDSALRCALRMLDWLGHPQHATAVPLVASGDGQGLDSALTTA